MLGVAEGVESVKATPEGHRTGQGKGRGQCLRGWGPVLGCKSSIPAFAESAEESTPP